MPRIRPRPNTFERTLCKCCYRDLRRIKYKFPHARQTINNECDHCIETECIVEMHRVSVRMKRVRHRWLVGQMPRNCMRTRIKPFLEPPTPWTTRQLMSRWRHEVSGHDSSGIKNTRAYRRLRKPAFEYGCWDDIPVDGKLSRILKQLDASEKEGFEQVRWRRRVRRKRPPLP